MHYLEKFNSKQIWIFGFVLLSALLLLPGTPISYGVLLPILLCGLFNNYRLEIVFLYSLLAGILFHKNFYSIHVFIYALENPLELFTRNEIFPAESVGYYLAGFVTYLCFFTLVFKLHKKFFEKLTLLSVSMISFFILGFIWAGQKLIGTQTYWGIVLSLAGVVLSRCAFYLFNYVQFFDKLPNDKKSMCATVQPFWFLTFEVPENPVYEISVPGTEEEKEQNKFTLNILFSCIFFKLILVFYFSIWNYMMSGQFQVVLDDVSLVNELGISILKSWQHQNALVLLLCLFSIAFSYLGSSFFVYGRMVVSVARLCGFNLPDYINHPWRSRSFADFFSRIMYYYNIIVINFFFYPALEFCRKLNLSRRARVFVSLNWALIFGGFLARYLKDIYKVYKFGFIKSMKMNVMFSLPYLVVLSLAVTLSLYFEKKKHADKTNVLRMLFYFFLYSLISSLNFSYVFGNYKNALYFYLKIMTLGIFS